MGWDRKRSCVLFSFNDSDFFWVRDFREFFIIEVKVEER